jgi:hypothetical protein
LWRGISLFSAKPLQTTGCQTAEVPGLRLRQAFWLLAVSGCKFERYLSVLFRRRSFFERFHGAHFLERMDALAKER